MSDNNLSEEINTNNYDDKVEQPPKKVSGGVCSVNFIKRHARLVYKLIVRVFYVIKLLIIIDYVNLLDQNKYQLNLLF